MEGFKEIDSIPPPPPFKRNIWMYDRADIPLIKRKMALPSMKWMKESKSHKDMTASQRCNSYLFKFKFVFVMHKKIGE